jgi:predicted RNA binding protein YcfA (HicA-like mRNA interferase family)
MPRLTPISRRNLIERLLKLGFEGPYTGGKHEFFLRGNVRLILPNPHRGDLSIDLLKRILRQAGVTRDEWDEAGRE